MNSRNLFYVRNLQSKFYFQKNQIVKSLFFLENYLFSLTKQTEEELIVKIKIKWIYDQIAKGDFSNEITKNLKALNNKVFSKKVLDLIEFYSDSMSSPNNIEFLSIFNNFNKKFNNLLMLAKAKNFKSLSLFQLVQFQYINNLDINYIMINDCFTRIEKDLIDIFEFVFIDILLKKKKKLKITKTYYLFRLLLHSIKK